MTRAVAEDLARKDSTVNYVASGRTVTELFFEGKASLWHETKNAPPQPAPSSPSSSRPAHPHPAGAGALGLQPADRRRRDRGIAVGWRRDPRWVRLDETFGHLGPQQAYPSRAPARVTAIDYDGLGGWVRVYAAGTLASSSWAEPEDLSWAVRRKHSFLLMPPLETPPGEYLLRLEGLALHAAHKQAQFYISCAQLRVTGNGTRTLGPLVNFPGTYTPTIPGLLIPGFWMYIKNYTPRPRRLGRRG
ncbi:hypothetical protein DL770_002011 [Monosporascus sp. CRB-9-2]|nr:hypothetical protein DL770_002011 [Monosporascus sp. CRB-9-2]